LEKNTRFKKEFREWPKEHRDDWKASVLFFDGPNHDFLKDWRNDMGGHFSNSAARFSIDNIHDDEVALIEADSNGVTDTHFRFAHQLVVGAVMKNQGNKDALAFIQEAFSFLANAAEKARTAALVLTVNLVLPRFRVRY
jgi:hypothetical protein